MADQHAGEARIEGAEIVIRVPIDYLPDIAAGAEDGGVITDAAVFAVDLVVELNREEDGDGGVNRFQRVLDDAIAEAINQGARGVELDD